jgi:hypothetical protein
MSFHQAPPTPEERSLNSPRIQRIPNTYNRPPGYSERDPPHEAQPPGGQPNCSDRDPPHEAQPPGGYPTRKSTLPERNSSKATHWGDKLQAKEPNKVRIGIRNVNSLPSSSQDPEHIQIVEDIRTAELDIIGLSEVNLSWQNISEQENIHNRFKYNFEASKFIASNNRLDSPIGTKTQFGGTITGVIGRTTFRVAQHGVDDRKLGRWSWISARGKGNTNTRIVTIYRPVKGVGPRTTYQQQEDALRDLGILGCP